MLTDKQIERYSRQIILPQVGGCGQERLLAASVAVVGIGGVGSVAAAYLTAAGIGRLGIIDDAFVPSADLSCGLLHCRLGQQRAPSAATALAELNPDCQIEPCAEPLTAGLAADVFSAHDLVVSTTTRFTDCCLLNAASLRLRKPFLWGRAAGFNGELTAFSGHHSDTPCFQCLHPAAPRAASAEDGPMTVFGPAAGFTGTVLAIEALKMMLGLEDRLTGRLVTFDAHAGAVREVTVRKDPQCAACGVAPKVQGPTR
jgi:molybdopterin/thiamine biosynthesis adenylyltransferase